MRFFVPIILLFCVYCQGAGHTVGVGGAIEWQKKAIGSQFESDIGNGISSDIWLFANYVYSHTFHILVAYSSLTMVNDSIPAQNGEVRSSELIVSPRWSVPVSPQGRDYAFVLGTYRSKRVIGLGADTRINQWGGGAGFYHLLSDRLIFQVEAEWSNTPEYTHPITGLGQHYTSICMRMGFQLLLF